MGEIGYTEVALIAAVILLTIMQVIQEVRLNRWIAASLEYVTAIDTTLKEHAKAGLSLLELDKQKHKAMDHLRQVIDNNADVLTVVAGKQHLTKKEVASVKADMCYKFNRVLGLLDKHVIQSKIAERTAIMANERATQTSIDFKALEKSKTHVKFVPQKDLARFNEQVEKIFNPGLEDFQDFRAPFGDANGNTEG